MASEVSCEHGLLMKRRIIENFHYFYGIKIILYLFAEIDIPWFEPFLLLWTLRIRESIEIRGNCQWTDELCISYSFDVAYCIHYQISRGVEKHSDIVFNRSVCLFLIWINWFEFHLSFRNVSENRKLCPLKLQLRTIKGYWITVELHSLFFFL